MLSLKSASATLLVLFMASASQVQAQMLQGKFADQKGHYVIYNDAGLLEFCLMQYSGLNTDIAAAGTCKIDNGQMVVRLKYGYPEGSKSSYTVEQITGGGVHFYVQHAKEGLPLRGRLMYRINGENKSVSTDSNGYAPVNFPVMPDDSVLTVRVFGFDDRRIKLSALQGLTYRIQAVKGSLFYRDHNTRRMDLRYHLDQDTLWVGFDEKHLTRLSRVN